MGKERTKPWLILPVLLLAVALELAACGNRTENPSDNPNMKANEAPPAAPFGINVQNLNDDNNYMKYKELQSQEVNHEGHITIAQSKLILSDRLANAIMELDGIRDAAVLLSADQAYVAVAPAVPDGTEVAAVTDVPPELQAAITDKVKQLDIGVRQVLITAQADYMERFTAIRAEKQTKQSAEALKQELFQMFTRIIPSPTGGGGGLLP